MSGNSAQRKRDKKRSVRVLEAIRAALNTSIRPMVKDECLKDFEEAVNGLTEMIEDIKKPSTRASDMTGF